MSATENPGDDMKLEVIVLPVADADRAKEFYSGSAGGSTPTEPGTASAWSSSPLRAPGARSNSARTSPRPNPARPRACTWSSPTSRPRTTIWSGAVPTVSEVFHCSAGTMSGSGTARARSSAPAGPRPIATSYGSFATFSDPDGNGWVFQEVTTRLPGRVDSAATLFGSASDLARAMGRASRAHGEHEKRIGKADPDWPGWYAEYMVAEQAGTGLPT